MTKHFTHPILLVCVAATGLLFCLPSHAQTVSTTPSIGFTQGVACSPNGSLGYNGNSFVACASGAWAVQPITIGTASSPPVTCNPATEGMLYFDTGGTAVKVCNGSIWTAVGAGVTWPLAGASDSAGAPDYSWSGHTTTGLYYNSGIGFAVGGATIANITSTGLTIGTSSPDQFLSLDGQAARTIDMTPETTAGTAGNNLTVRAGGGYAGNNLNGGTLILSSGIATGTGSSGINFQSYNAASGTGSSTYATTALTLVAVGTSGTSKAGGTGTSYGTTLQGISTAGLGSDYNGGNLTIAAGISTGTGSSSINFNVYGAGSSGSTSNAATTAMTILGNGNVGIGVTSPAYPLHLSASAANSYGMYINTTGASSTAVYGNGTQYGVYGATPGASGGTQFGVYGISTGTSGSNYGVYGYGNNGSGSVNNNYGVFGDATSTSSASATNNYGVYGNGGPLGGTVTNSYGVYGITNGNATTLNYGVYGTDIGTTGAGGYFTSSSGYALITGTGNVGIGTAVPGALLTVGNNNFEVTSGGATTITGSATAQLSVTNNGGNYGVQGLSVGTTGTTYGGYFYNSSAGGAGVYGSDNGAGGVGVFGSAAVATGHGIGVEGTTVTNKGVYGSANYGSGTGTGVYGDTGSGIGGYFTGGSGYALITGSGNVGIGTATPQHALDVNGNIGIAASGYLNFGPTDSSGGYGIRDNSGTIQCKNSGGAWAACGLTWPLAGATDSVGAPDYSWSGHATTGLYYNSGIGFAVGGASIATMTATGLGIGSSSPVVSLDLSQKTDALALPIGTTGQEPGTVMNGMIRYNKTINDLEAYINGAWTSLTTGGSTASITLGTSAATPDPASSFSAATGLFSSASGQVSVTSTGNEIARFTGTGVSIGTTYVSTASPTNGMIVQGNVGIGTATPQTALDVNGNVMSESNGFITQIANDTGTGTTVNKLAKLTTSGKAIKAATTDTDNMLGIVIGGAGTSGSAQIAIGGQASCVFDGATTAGDYVGISSGTAGDCHDTGTGRPVISETIGRVLSTNASGGTYAIALQLGTMGTGGGQLLGVYSSGTAVSNNSIVFTGAANSAPSFSGTTLTLASNTSYIVVETWGAGGGGVGGGNGSAGGSGNSSCFGTNSTACTSPTASATGGGGAGAGGVGSGGDINLTGGSSSGGSGTTAALNYFGGSSGGCAPLGGGGGSSTYSSAGNTGSAYGGGGGGGGENGMDSSYLSSAGGGGGGYASKFINNPSGTYYYTIGSGGSGGAIGACGGGTCYIGGAGGAGGIKISAYATVTGGVTTGSLSSGGVCTSNGSLVSCSTTFTNNVIPKGSSGSGLTASSLTDDGTEVYTTENLGIGTTTPAALLDIYSTSTNSTYMNITNKATGGHTWTLYSSGGGPATTGYFGIYDLSGGGNRLVINTSGDVGIGTTGPMGGGSLLTVNGIAGILNGNGLQIYESGNSAWATLNFNGTSVTDNYGFNVSGTVTATGVTINNSSTTAITVNGGSGSSNFALNTTTSGGHTGYVQEVSNDTLLFYEDSNGMYLTSGATAWTANSDRRLKKDIQPLSDERGLAAIEQLNPVTFHWKDAKTDKNQGQQLGFIAQDVQKVFQNLVTHGKSTTIKLDDGSTQTVSNPLGLSMTGLIPPLVKSVQELRAENDDLRRRDGELRAANDREAAEIKVLRTRLDAVEAARH